MTILGKIEKYKFKPFIELERALEMYNNKNVLIEIRSYRYNRSLAQNNYYFGAVVSAFNAGYEIENAERLTPGEGHTMLKTKFNNKLYILKNSGEIIIAPRSTTELSTIEFSEYLDKTKSWIWDYYKIPILEPDEYFKKNT